MMNRFIRSSILLFALIFSVTLGLAQPPPPASGGSGATRAFSWGLIKDLPAAAPFVSLDGRYSIALPQRVSGFGGVSPQEQAQGFDGFVYTWKFDDGEIKIIFAESKNESLVVTEQDLERFTNNAKTDKLPDQIAGEAVMTKINGYPVSKISVKFANNFEAFMFSYLDKNRLYRIQAVVRDGETAQSLKKVLDTFKIISDAEAADFLRRKVEAAMPAALPQEPALKTPVTDAQIENLKGKVKSTFEETEDLSGTWSKQGRKPSRETFYNPNGDALKSIGYDYQGNPDTITVFGYLDGARVSKNGYVDYEYNPPAPMAKPTLPGIVPKKRDSRYGTKYETKYDEKGRLKESLRYDNDGELSGRSVYVYEGNKRESTSFDSAGKQTFKTVSLFDEKGNIIEQTNTYPGRDGEQKSEYKYSYEFDARGNWIKRITHKPATKDGKVVFEPSSVTYRAITYF